MTGNCPVEQKSVLDNKGRTVYFDYLRIAATLAVMLLHIASQNWYSTDVNGFDWKVFNFYDSIVRWGVPVFVMISGALFLKRDTVSVKSIYTKYVLRLFVAFCVWSFVYYLFDSSSDSSSIIEQFMGLFSAGKSEKWASLVDGHYHLWFIPMIAGLYMCLPILKQIVANEKVARYFLALSFFFWFAIPQTVSLVQQLCSGSAVLVVNELYATLNDTDMKLVMNFSFYFILGYIIANTEFSPKQRTIIYALGIIGFAFTVIVDLKFAIKYQKPFGNYYSSSTVNVLLEAIAVFELFKNLRFNNTKLNAAALKLSTWSFGAYLVHALIIDYLQRFGVNTLSFSTSVLAVPIIAAAVFVISFSISAILHSIPILNKYIV